MQDIGVSKEKANEDKMLSIVLDAGADDQGIGIQSHDDVGLVSLEQPLVAGGDLDPEPAEPTGRSRRRGQHHDVRGKLLRAPGEAYAATGIVNGDNDP